MGISVIGICKGKSNTTDLGRYIRQGLSPRQISARTGLPFKECRREWLIGRTAIEETRGFEESNWPSSLLRLASAAQLSNDLEQDLSISTGFAHRLRVAVGIQSLR